MKTSLFSPRHTRRYGVAISAALRRCVGARVCNPQQRSSEPGAQTRPTTHSVAADGKSAFLAAVALPAALAWAALPLSAEVLDDFSGPKKFLLRGRDWEPGYVLDGQMRFTPSSAPGSAGSFLYHRTYELPEGTPVEFSLDLVNLNNESLLAGMMVNFMPQVDQGGYGFYWTQEMVYLDKLEGGYRFLEASHPYSPEPVTVSLTLTQEGSSLKLGTRAVRRDEPGHVIFERQVTDGSGVDGQGDTGSPPAGPVVRVLFFLVGSSDGTEVIVDNFKCSADPTPVRLAIQRVGGAGADVEWRSENVLLEADALQGPWKPWPGAVSGESGAYHAAMAMGNQAKFLRLRSGEQWLDLFSTAGGGLLDWQVDAPVPGPWDVPAFILSNGRARFSGTAVRNADFLLFRPLGRWPYHDCVASVDLVDWGEDMEDGGFGIVLRASRGKELWYPATEGLPQNRYVGSLTFKKAEAPSESALSLTGPGGEVLTSQSFPAVDPAKQYRLRFWAVGDRLTLELFSLDDLGNEAAVKSCEATDGRVAEGLDAMYGTKSSGDTYDVTIDRYLFSGVSR